MRLGYSSGLNIGRLGVCHSAVFGADSYTRISKEFGIRHRANS